MSERPGIQTPWLGINQLLASEERFEFRLPHWQGFLLTPIHPSQLAALLYFIRQEGIQACVQGRGTNALPLSRHQVIISTRAFTKIVWHEDGIVEVGAGCSLSYLYQFLFERNQEVALEGELLGFPKRSVAALILMGQTGGMRYRTESFLETLLGLEFVTWEGSQVKWGGPYGSALAGPAWQKLMWGLQSFPGIVFKTILKTYPRPPVRLQMAWKFHRKEELWHQFHVLNHFCSSWEYLEAVLSGNEEDQGFIFAQISGVPEEMEAFSQACPFYQTATHQGERGRLKSFLMAQKLKIYSVSRDFHEWERGEYFWLSNWNQNAYWLTTKEIEKEESSTPLWKQRLFH